MEPFEIGWALFQLFLDLVLSLAGVRASSQGDGFLFSFFAILGNAAWSLLSFVFWLLWTLLVELPMKAVVSLVQCFGLPHETREPQEQSRPPIVTRGRGRLSGRHVVATRAEAAAEPAPCLAQRRGVHLWESPGASGLIRQKPSRSTSGFSGLATVSFDARRATCPVCAAPISGEARQCPSCRAPHHDDCWSYNGGCAIFACRGRSAA